MCRILPAPSHSQCFSGDQSVHACFLPDLLFVDQPVYNLYFSESTSFFVFSFLIFFDLYVRETENVCALLSLLSLCDVL